MDKDEFERVWNEHGGIGGLRIIRFDGGSIFATRYVMILVTGREVEYDLLDFTKEVGGVVIETGTLRLDKVTGVN